MTAPRHSDQSLRILACAQRLVFEYDRDRKLGREDVGEPVGIDLARPHAAPPSHGPSFFAGWLKGL